MTWFKEQKLSWLQRLCLNTLKSGVVPNHVAFIMDGNRRFASKRNIQSIEGHILGFEKLTQTLEWCLQLGIAEITVYAFSIENFKRSEEEVSALMELAQERFKDLLQEKEKIEKYGVCIRVIGNLSLLPKELQNLVAEAVLLTEKNNGVYLNVCLSYTSRHEVCSAIDDLVAGINTGLIQPEDISESLISSCLFIPSEPDLVVRTSGEVRLSDFLLWQCGYSILAFLKVLWPEFDIYHLFLGVLFYQFNFQDAQKTKNVHKSLTDRLDATSDVTAILSQLNLNLDYTSDHKQVEVEPDTEEQLESYRKNKSQRVNQFLLHINEKRRQMLEGLRDEIKKAC